VFKGDYGVVEVL